MIQLPFIPLRNLQIPMTQLDKNAIFSIVKEMEAAQQQCINKVRYLDNVVSGREPVTFSVIDRCREVALQVKQYSHVFNTHLITLPTDSQVNQEQLRQMMDEQTACVAKAATDIATILSWVPNAPNTRRNGLNGSTN